MNMSAVSRMVAIRCIPSVLSIPLSDHGVQFQCESARNTGIEKRTRVENDSGGQSIFPIGPQGGAN